MKPGDFPRQEICDTDNPTEAFAWALVALPHMRGGALPMTSEYLQLVSERLWRCGFRFHPELQELKWVPPSAGDPHWLTSPGRWVPVDEPLVIEAQQ